MSRPDEARQTFGEGISDEYLDEIGDRLGAEAAGAVAAYGDLGEDALRPLVEWVDSPGSGVSSTARLMVTASPASGCCP